VKSLGIDSDEIINIKGNWNTMTNKSSVKQGLSYLGSTVLFAGNRIIVACAEQVSREHTLPQLDSKTRKEK
jgi:hypothetical protein